MTASFRMPSIKPESSRLMTFSKLPTSLFEFGFILKTEDLLVTKNYLTNLPNSFQSAAIVFGTTKETKPFSRFECNASVQIFSTLDQSPEFPNSNVEQLLITARISPTFFTLRVS